MGKLNGTAAGTATGTEQNPGPGRPRSMRYPESIPDSPENIARAIMSAPPKGRLEAISKGIIYVATQDLGQIMERSEAPAGISLREARYTGRPPQETVAIPEPATEPEPGTGTVTD